MVINWGGRTCRRSSRRVDRPHTRPGASRRMRGDCVEVARVVGVAGVLTDPIRGRVRPVVARVVGVAGVLTDPIRGRVRPAVWGVIMILGRSHVL
ncbi:unnamed protein product [Prunus armeniaca]